MLERDVTRHIYTPSTPVKRAISDLYRKGTTICLVCDKRRRLLGVVTMADIKQGLLKGIDPHAPLRSIMNTDFTWALAGTPLTTLKKTASQPSRYKTGTLSSIPLLDERKRLVALYMDSKAPAPAPHTVLVTGGAGYMGSLLCRHLLKDGYRVVVLDKLLFGDAGIKDLYADKNFTLIHGDIGDIGTLTQAIQGADSVVHLAGIVGDPACALNPIQTMEENHFSTKMMIDLCQYYQVSRFIFSSSCSVYGTSASRSDERSQLHPVSLYAQSKMYSERELLRAAGANFHPVILRFGTLYGYSPRMRFDLVVNVMTARAFFNKHITVDGGSQWRPLVHVDDAARALRAALNAPLGHVSGQIFNVGDSDENYQISEIAEEVRHCLPKTEIAQLDTVKDRRDYRVSFAKMRKVLRFKVKHTLRHSIIGMVRQMQNGKFKDWKKKKYSNYLTLRNTLEKDL
ncbi:MAG: NAD-dependent epimerase/dehydratase family protein [bacterium]|nr:NAD-dependent epimerase/dehydratase family protein [bacterium]